jgi:hypothetical protein
MKVDGQLRQYDYRQPLKLSECHKGMIIRYSYDRYNGTFYEGKIKKFVGDEFRPAIRVEFTTLIIGNSRTKINETLDLIVRRG